MEGGSVIGSVEEGLEVGDAQSDGLYLSCKDGCVVIPSDW